MLHPLFQKIWKEEDIPAEWKEGYLIKLPKKGDLSNCSNYRRITLLSIPGKVFYRILLNRMKDVVNPLLRDQQAGFRAGRSCADQIATLRIILEQSLEWNSPLYINFMDYIKAFDSVHRQSLWKLMRHYGIPEKITNIVRNSYEGMSCRVVHGKDLTASFQVRTGVRQGCLLSPFLFLLAMDWIMSTSTANWKNGIQWDSMETSWRLRLCRWCRVALTHPTLNAGKYHYHQSKFCPHWTGYSSNEKSDSQGQYREHNTHRTRW